jgi:hypothetical protein
MTSRSISSAAFRVLFIVALVATWVGLGRLFGPFCEPGSGAVDVIDYYLIGPIAGIFVLAVLGMALIALFRVLQLLWQLGGAVEQDLRNYLNGGNGGQP